MSDSTWDEVRRLADELELKIHLAGMDARDRWHELEPRLEKLEHAIVHSTEQVGESVVHELHDVRDALRTLREELYGQAHDNYDRGW